MPFGIPFRKRLSRDKCNHLKSLKVKKTAKTFILRGFKRSSATFRNNPKRSEIIAVVPGERLELSRCLGGGF